MKFAHLLARATGTPWLITESGGSAVSALLNSRLASTALVPSADAAEIADTAWAELSPGIALIPVRGILGKNLGMMETLCGGCDVDRVLSSIEDAAASSAIAKIVLHVDSPGGAATGIPEAHAAILRLSAESQKPIYAFVDGQCCSGGVYLAAACDAIFCTRSAMLGSVGAITQLKLRVMANAAEGIEVRTYKHGKFKDLGNPNRPPTPEEEALIQARIDHIGNLFAADMKAARPQLAAEVFDALVYYGPDAVRVGLADEMVSDLASLTEHLATAAN